MKVIFAGPTLYGANLPSNADYQLRPPARQGDFHKAIQDGATVIGLIDGVYEYVPAIWHKEILFGLAQGVHIFGAASMGALRAAECAAFGMVGIGEIFDGYMSGALEDDSDVAQSHAPAEVGFLPLSEPLVNVRATILRCLQLSHITAAEHDRLLVAAKAIFFKDRTYRQLVLSSISDGVRASEVLAILRANSVNQKLQDAQRLIEAVTGTPDRRFVPQFSWTFEATSFWKATFPTISLTES
ncbi:antibiotic resistance protein [Agrobacterium rhizogenes]|uniref:TfuA-like protein n=1 Tax=Rhizobium rhizogenes TaxID=359 RepID=UPI000645843C|nr:TfuA-like protein [Rhizobium rhizogenes]NTG05250.1 antibiotic resistance protein [Rhizobium rhizogenes]NTG09540.1 antibiotic resistance protein [Rhizobium rhizogenes]NTG16386.1 antibiotic resistance protein [Rhizobium rhizogenes]NTG22552.1 antibiotic resistance protein [Rhizobium rhizogenes]NTG32376.1 antibiotic resistance protein [Rhizobium rhizogenes]